MANRNMNDEIEGLERLAGIARAEGPPAIDVSGPVLARLRAYHQPVQREFALMAIGAFVAAAAVAAISLPYFSAAFDPLSNLMEATAMTLI